MPAKRGAGRPAFKPTEAQRDLVAEATAMGFRQEEVRRLVKNPTTGSPIDLKTLRLHFRDELDAGGIEPKVKVTRTLYQIATDPDHPKCVTAAIWITKARLGWSERTEVEVDDKRSGVLCVPGQQTEQDWVAAMKRHNEAVTPPSDASNN